jgi:hypothetical protein
MRDERFEVPRHQAYALDRETSQAASLRLGRFASDEDDDGASIADRKGER